MRTKDPKGYWNYINSSNKGADLKYDMLVRASGHTIEICVKQVV